MIKCDDEPGHCLVYCEYCIYAEIPEFEHDGKCKLLKIQIDRMDGENCDDFHCCLTQYQEKKKE